MRTWLWSRSVLTALDKAYPGRFYPARPAGLVFVWSGGKGVMAGPG